MLQIAGKSEQTTAKQENWSSCTVRRNSRNYSPVCRWWQVHNPLRFCTLRLITQFSRTSATRIRFLILLCSQPCTMASLLVRHTVVESNGWWNRNVPYTPPTYGGSVKVYYRTEYFLDVEVPQCNCTISCLICDCIVGQETFGRRLMSLRRNQGIEKGWNGLEWSVDEVNLSLEKEKRPE